MIHLKNILMLAVISLLTISAAFAKDKAPNSKIDSSSELQDYIAIQSLMAKDQYAGVPDLAKKLSAEAKAVHHTELANEAEKLSATTELTAARIQFVAVSNLILPIAKAKNDKNFEVVYCPMKKARWVQKTGPIANPYYGSEMLECGVKEK
jgi:hypothetical protein